MGGIGTVKPANEDEKQASLTPEMAVARFNEEWVDHEGTNYKKKIGEALDMAEKRKNSPERVRQNRWNGTREILAGAKSQGKLVLGKILDPYREGSQIFPYLSTEIEHCLQDYLSAAEETAAETLNITDYDSDFPSPAGRYYSRLDTNTALEFFDGSSSYFRRAIRCLNEEQTGEQIDAEHYEPDNLGWWQVKAERAYQVQKMSLRGELSELMRAKTSGSEDNTEELDRLCRAFRLESAQPDASKRLNLSTAITPYIHAGGVPQLNRIIAIF